MAIKDGTGIAYVATVDDVSIYDVKINDVLIFQAGVKDDLKIMIRKTITDPWNVTAGSTIKSGHRPSGAGVQAFIVMNMSKILLDLYVFSSVPIDVPDNVPTDWS
jgi:hypothetical protein